MLIDLFKGARFLLDGFGLLGKPGIRRHAFLPILLSALVFAALLWAGILWFPLLLDCLHELIPAWLAWLDPLFWLLFVASVLLLFLYGFVLLAGLLSSPFNGPLSEAVESRLGGRPPPSTPLLRALRRLPWTLFQEGKKVCYPLVLALPFLLLFLVPGLNLGAPLLWILFLSWTTALAFLDYPMSNHGLALAEMRQVLRARPGLALGFGASCFCLLALPLLNLLVLPAAVCGATKMWVEELEPSSAQGGR